MLDTRVGAGDKDDPADVARDGFQALMAGKERVVSASLSTKLQGRGGRLVPDKFARARVKRMPAPGAAQRGRRRRRDDAADTPIFAAAANYGAGARAAPDSLVPSHYHLVLPPAFEAGN
jgi:hypothetical protein